MKKRARKNPRDKPRGLLEEAVALHQTGNLSEAAKRYGKLLEQGRFGAKVSNLMGVLMFQMGRPEDSRSFFERSLSIDPANVETYGNYSSTLEMLGDVKAALSVCRKGMEQAGNPIELRSKVFGYLVTKREYEEAIALGEGILAENKENLSVAANLNAAYFHSDRIDKALYWGERFLTGRDAQVSRVAGSRKRPAGAGNSSPGAVKALDKIIAFSLWGTNAFYTDGAVRNAELASEIYPDWKCRFYCGATVPDRVLESLRRLGCQIEMMNEEAGFGGTFWRFLVADDVSVERFMIRDADSRINPREQSAVAEWIASGKAFHVMRDAVVHCDLMLAGLWGGTSGVLPPMSKMLEEYPEKLPKFADQNFLATKIWPLIKTDVLIHDSHYRCFESRPFPANTELDGQYHVGAGVAVSADPPRSLSEV